MRGVESAPGVVTMMAKGKAHVATPRRSIPAHCRRQTKASLLRRSASGRRSCRARLNCTRDSDSGSHSATEVDSEARGMWSDRSTRSPWRDIKCIVRKTETRNAAC
jgi:hypothetical protein